jgi:hypothetical protein
MDEIDFKGKTLPVINFLKKGGFYIYRRRKGGGIIALFIKLNNILILISRGINCINKIKCFLYYKKEYY